jgi:hypothetical protein
MTTYRVRYRTAAVFNEDGVQQAPPGSWLAATDTASRSATVGNLLNGTTYDFAVGRIVDGRVGAWSNLPSATPLGVSGDLYDKEGTFEVSESTVLSQITRVSTSTTLILSNNWVYVVIDYVSSGAKKHGVTKTSGQKLPTDYTANLDVITKGSGQDGNVVTIRLASSQAFTFRVQGSGGSSTTVSLLAVV